eukprot:TRINITY_DN9053_c0_g1_i2.p1 TRINITY_DN9053_c0_g1~~TRINITY_DN9053_c0_g1_i2.p1  ORF type:complete len:386 (-),score=109.42 TRINITY_DN9053_c0_g1_i2:364-1521(-)
MNASLTDAHGLSSMGNSGCSPLTLADEIMQAECDAMMEKIREMADRVCEDQQLEGSMEEMLTATGYTKALAAVESACELLEFSLDKHGNAGEIDGGGSRNSMERGIRISCERERELWTLERIKLYDITQQLKSQLEDIKKAAGSLRDTSGSEPSWATTVVTDNQSPAMGRTRSDSTEARMRAVSFSPVDLEAAFERACPMADLSYTPSTASAGASTSPKSSPPVELMSRQGPQVSGAQLRRMITQLENELQPGVHREEQLVRVIAAQNADLAQLQRSVLRQKQLAKRRLDAQQVQHSEASERQLAEFVQARLEAADVAQKLQGRVLELQEELATCKDQRDAEEWLDEMDENQNGNLHEGYNGMPDQQVEAVQEQVQRGLGLGFEG